MIFSFFVYNLILFVACSFAFLAEKVKSGNQEYICRVSVFLILWIPAAIRYGIGTDYMSYAEIYQHIGSYTDSVEIGYVLLNQLLHWTDLDTQWVFVLSSFIIYFPVCFVLPKKSYFIMITFYILTCYFASFSLVRQSMAVSFIICATVALLRGRRSLYFIYVTVAALFHLSAVLMFIFYFIRTLKLNKWGWFACVAVIAYAVVALDFISAIFSSPLFLDTSYGGYATNDFNRETEIGSGIGVLVKWLFPCCIIFYSKGMSSLNKENNFIVVISVGYLAFSVFTLQIHIFTRLVDLVTFVFLFAAGLFYSYKIKMRQLLLGGMLVLFLVLYEHTILIGQISKQEGLGISPYTTIFTD